MSNDSDADPTWIGNTVGPPENFEESDSSDNHGEGRRPVNSEPPQNKLVKQIMWLKLHYNIFSDLAAVNSWTEYHEDCRYANIFQFCSWKEVKVFQPHLREKRQIMNKFKAKMERKLKHPELPKL
ncbi:hypothetical protein JTB14_005362 [Gonioctena quinquepunctata]|nr:hypothetical protein JTB14_005362 [Gonioctena quinquepunctata]